MFNLGSNPTDNTDGVPRPEQRIFGLEPVRMGTNQEARPLPWLRGRQPIGVTWITNAINPYADPITRNVVVGKRETQEMTVGHIYYAQIAGWLCHGASRIFIEEIWVGDTRKWSGLVEISLPFTSLTIPDFGVVRIYPGSSNQNVDSLLGGLGHPAYRGICYWVWDPMIFGRDMPNAPQCEVVLSCRTSVPGWDNPAIEGDVCPLHAAVELASHPSFGGGLRLGEIGKASIDLLSADLVAQDLLCSPLLTNVAPLGQQLVEILQYANATLCQDEGIYKAVSYSRPEDFDNAPIIEIEDCTALPETEPQHVETAAAETRMSFSDRARRGKDSQTPPYHDDALHALGVDTASDLRRPFYTRQSVANRAVGKAGRLQALPAVAGRVPILRSKALALKGGKPFRLRPYKGATYLLNCRVKKWNQASSTDQEIMIDYTVDYASGGAGDSADEYTPPEATVYGAVPIYRERLFALPAAFPGVDDGTWLAYLPVRAHSLITSYAVHRARDEAGPYKAYVQGSQFCAYGSLVAAISDADTGATLTMHDVDRQTYEAQTTADADAGDLLAFIGGECISLEGYAPGASLSLTLSSMRRGFNGTAAASHPAGTEVFIVEARALTLIGPHDGGSAGFWFKTVSATLRGVQPLDTAIILNSAETPLIDEGGAFFEDEDGAIFIDE